MTTGKIKIIASLLAIAVAGCIPDPLDVGNVPTLTPHIVVSSQVIPGQSIAVLLTKSISALDAGSSTNADTLLNEIVINDATVTIEWQDNIDTLIFFGTGLYGTPSVPLVTGDTYKLTVNSTSLGVVTATTKMNEVVSFDSVSASLVVQDRDTLGSVSYQLTDPPGNNWYMIDVQRYRDPKVNLLKNLNPRIFIKALNDDEFQGAIKAETFTIPFRRFHKGDTVAVILANISEEYYSYLKDRIDGQNTISDFVSEPLNLPTNVVNGYGFFNMQVPDVHVFKME